MLNREEIWRSNDAILEKFPCKCFIQTLQNIAKDYDNFEAFENYLHIVSTSNSMCKHISLKKKYAQVLKTL